MPKHKSRHHKSSRHSRSQYEKLLEQVQSIVADLRDREVRLPLAASSAFDVRGSPSSGRTLQADEPTKETQTVAQADRGSEPDAPEFMVNDASQELNSPLMEVAVEDSLQPQEAEAQALVNKLFKADKNLASSLSWNAVMLEAIKAKVRKGLSEEVLANFLAKYEVKGDLAALAPPKLNKELASVLAPSVLKRDEYQVRSQAQVGACLNAFGSGISILLKEDTLQELSEDSRSALSFFSEGMHLLSDHLYRLSLARRAFAKPSLNLVGKNAADAAEIDDYLFGQNFTETLKTAQAVEKTGRDISKVTPQVGKKTQQPVRQQPGQQQLPKRVSQMPVSKSRFQGNRRAPAHQSSARSTGASYSRSRHSQRSRSRSRQQH